MAKVLTKIPKFRRCVLQNFPFIEQDFDALTDYQLLCKVVEYLNKVITSQNEVIDVAESLTAAFNELQSFVANYFDNLDVQEEINNKLDAMAEAGTLQEIITAYIQSNVAWCFDTVADMKAATNLVAGSYARTLGFHTINDGGGATYYITDTGTADEMQFIAIGSLYANLVIPAVLTPEMLGAYGDGIKNDTNSILRAVALSDVKGNKKYKVTSEINLNGHNLDIHEFTGEVTISNGSEAGKPVKVNIDLADTLILQNFKNSQFYLGKVTSLNITATDSSNAFAYNTIHGGQVSNLYIYGNTTTAWVNENIFYNLRVSSVLSIVGNGYPHNHNKFYDCVCEDATNITLTHTYCNYFSFRGETYPTITVNDDNFTYGNVFDNDWYSYNGGYWATIPSEEKIDGNNIYRKADFIYLNDYLVYSAPVDPATYTISLPSYTTLKSFIVDASNGGAFRFKSDSNTFRIRVTPLNSNNEPYADNPNAIISNNIPWNSTNKYYWQTLNSSYAGFVVNSKSQVSKLLVEIYNYAAGTAHYVNLTYSGMRPVISEVSS